jgi:hypothetical protein
MSTVIYAAKMYAFGEQLHFDRIKIDKLHRICLFNSLIYVKAWLSATSAADAPINDLRLWNDLHEYRKIDPAIAEAAIKTLDRHLWYITEEVAPFALFSTLVTETEKKQIVQSLIKARDDKPLQKGVPTFPQLKSSTKLHFLIGRNSWQLYNCLHVNTNWFHLPPTQWASGGDYRSVEMFVKNVHVVNDLAERAIKLITDFAGSITNDENQRQFLLQCVEQHRHTVHDFSKESFQNI